MTEKVLITDEMINDEMENHAHAVNWYDGFKEGADWTRKKVAELLSTHTREVAEKAFEAGRTISLKDYNPDLKIGEHPLKYKSFEDYLNSLNPK